ncbi:MAG: hypothetical protein ACT4TC_09205, partial [Myxococcaceae bacterium]
EQVSIAIAASVVVGVLAVYALVKVVSGRRRYVREKSAFEKLKAIRRELNADDPAAFLPQ